MVSELDLKKDSLQPDREDRPLLGSGGNSRRVLTSFIVIAGLLGVGAFGLYAYNKGKEDGRSNIPPIIKPKEGPTKVRPDHPGGMKVPNRDKEVFDRFNKRSSRPKIEIILGAPEEPLRPRNSKAQKSEKKRSKGQSKRSMIQQPENILIKNKTSIEGSRKNEATTQAPAITTNNESKARPEKGASKQKKFYKVQLASLRSKSSAQDAWRLIKKKNSKLMEKLSLNIERKDLGGSRGVYFRLQAGPISTQMEAQALCAKLKARKVSCIVVSR